MDVISFNLLTTFLLSFFPYHEHEELNSVNSFHTIINFLPGKQKVAE